MGAQTTRLASGMVRVKSLEESLDVELSAHACVQLLNTDVEFGPKLRERLNALEKIAPELLLICFGKRLCF